MQILMTLIGLSYSAVYVAMGWYVWRHATRGAMFRWLLALVVVGLVNSLAVMQSAQQVVIASLTVIQWIALGAVTVSALDRSMPVGWVVLNTFLFLLTIVAHATYGPALVFVALLGWLVGGFWLGSWVLPVHRQASLPEQASHTLYWLIPVPCMILGGLIVMGAAPLWDIIGGTFVLLSVALALFGSTHYRPRSNRRLLLLAMQYIVMTIALAAMIWFALIIAVRVQSAPSDDNRLLWGTIAFVVAIFFTVVWLLLQILTRQLFASRADAINVLHRYGQQMAVMAEPGLIAELALKTVGDVLNAHPGGILVASFADDFQHVRLMHGQPSIQSTQRIEAINLHVQSPVYRHLFLRQQPILQYDLWVDPVFAGIADGERLFFCQTGMNALAPIIVNGDVMGILYSGMKQDNSPFEPADLRLLAAIASQTGVGMMNAQLFIDLRRLNRELEDTNVDYAQLDSVKSDFITIASHELRTPLAQVRGYTDILDSLSQHSNGIDPAQMVTMTMNLRKATERMETLISDMLDVSKIDVDAMDLHFTHTTIEAVIRLAIEPLTDALRSREISLSARGLKQLPGIEADLKRLVQAFHNIIINGIKYTPDGGVIEIKAEHVPHESRIDEIHITVNDTGIGIDTENHELVFEKFFRAADPGLHSTGTTKFMGAGPGLGLTITRGIIAGHGGSIWVESEAHDAINLPGSTFHVLLPVRPPAYARRVLPFEETKPITAMESDVSELDAIAFAAHRVFEEAFDDDRDTPIMPQ